MRGKRSMSGRAFAVAIALAAGGASADAGDTGAAVEHDDAAVSDAADTAATADSVMRCMRENIPERLRLRELRLRTEGGDDDGRELRALVYLRRNEGRAAMTTYVEAPSDMAGTAYLWRELESRDETFVFIPELNRVRRVIGSGADSGLFDSEFSMRDLQQAQGAFSSGEQSLTGSDALDGRPVWRMRFVPGPEEPTVYLHVDAAVDQASCVTLQAEFVDGNGVVKRFSADPESLHAAGGVTYARRLRMHNLRNQRTSHAELSELELPESLPQRIFLPNAFFLGR